nr:MAG TPA: hypothetical protein [Caudoviricetes sp.]
MFSKEQPKQHIYLYYKNFNLFKFNQIFYTIS